MSLDARIPEGSSLTNKQMSDLRGVFQSFDRNGSGFISQAEFKEAMKRVHFRQEDDVEAIAMDMISRIDSDNDGHVSFQEFVNGVAYRTNAEGRSTARFRSLVNVMHSYGFAEAKKKAGKPTYLQSYGCWPPPVFLLIITIAEVIVYAVFSARECGGEANLECPISFSSELAFRTGCREEVWRFISYVFVHASVTHIVFNCILQLIVGVPLEMVHGPHRVLGVYLLGGIAGSLASSVFDVYANLVGASAAVYALAGAHVADTFLNWAEMPFRWLRAGVLFVLIAADLSTSIYNRYYSGTMTNVSYTGHMAGFLMGCTLGTSILKNLEGNKYEKIVSYIGVALAVGGVIFAIFFNIFYDYPFNSCPKL
eukprot:m.110392 g.110392  ORF g.110392 m.110392 type:complete len:367 (+) comp9220_c0_seq4:37-1137(+)